VGIPFNFAKIVEILSKSSKIYLRWAFAGKFAEFSRYVSLRCGINVEFYQRIKPSRLTIAILVKVKKISYA